jgi:hypothetical protein
VVVAGRAVADARPGGPTAERDEAVAEKAAHSGGRPRRTHSSARSLVGYGPLLCAITAAAYVKELLGKEMVWEKTENRRAAARALTGRRAQRPLAPYS